MNRSILILNAIIADRNGFRLGDLRIGEGLIQEVGDRLTPGYGDIVLDVRGGVVAPAFVDPHTHLRLPGDGESETFESGSRAGALGGYASLLAMPNTTPVVDNLSILSHLREMVKDLPLRIAFAASITKARQGEVLSPIGELASAGVRVFTDDGSGVQSNLVMRRALEVASRLGVVVAQHAETSEFFDGGVINEGLVSAELGLPGIPGISEELMVSRDIELATNTKAPIHFLHLSTARSAELVRSARANGLAVTAEVTPHHLFLDDGATRSFDSRFKVNPPLRDRASIEALWRAVGDGVFEVIGTDHAPHATWKKDAPIEIAAFGMLGLQNSFQVLLTGAQGVIADLGIIPKLPSQVIKSAQLLDNDPHPFELLAWLWRIISMISWQSASLIGDTGGSIGILDVGAIADLVVLDIEATRTMAIEALASKAKNSPYLGMTLNGAVRHLIVGGKALVIDEKLQEEGNWR